MDDRKQFTFYASFWEAIKELPAKYQLPTLRAIICYALFQEEPASLPPTCRAVFLLVKPTLDASRKKAANGKLGGQSGKQTESKPQANGERPPRESKDKKEKEKELEGENNKRSTPQAPLPDPPCHPERSEGSPGPSSAPSLGSPSGGAVTANAVTEGVTPPPTSTERPSPPPTSAEGSPPKPFDGKTFTAFWDAYPSKIGRDDAWEAWKTLSPDRDTAEQIMSALRLWKRSDQWQEDNGRFVPRAAKFLTKGHWRSPPSSAQPTTFQREPDQDEIDAIRRLMSEPLGSPPPVIARSDSDVAIPTPSAAPPNGAVFQRRDSAEGSPCLPLWGRCPEGADEGGEAAPPPPLGSLFEGAVKDLRSLTEGVPPVGASTARPFPADTDVPMAIRPTQGGRP